TISATAVPCEVAVAKCPWQKSCVVTFVGKSPLACATDRLAKPPSMIAMVTPSPMMWCANQAGAPPVATSSPGAAAGGKAGGARTDPTDDFRDRALSDTVGTVAVTHRFNEDCTVPPRRSTADRTTPDCFALITT